MTKNVLVIADLTGEEIASILELAKAPVAARPLSGLGAALVFEHPSARTRNASELAVFQLGGHPVTIRGDEVGFDKRETVEDVARTLASYHALIAARVAKHSTLERMAAALSDGGYAVPVINLLSDFEHPTQALADLLTIEQHFGRLHGVTVAFIGDANNVARSLGDALALSGASSSPRLFPTCQPIRLIASVQRAIRRSSRSPRKNFSTSSKRAPCTARKPGRSSFSEST